MDEVDADGNAITYYLDRRRDYARAGFDRKHVFNVDYVYELPAFAKQNEFLKKTINGWQIAGITRADFVGRHDSCGCARCSGWTRRKIKPGRDPGCP